MPTPESAAFLAKKPTVPPTFDGVDYDDNKQLKQAQDAVIREQWVQVMMGRLVREELNKCYRREGVNHLEKCGFWREKYLQLLSEHRVRVPAPILQAHHYLFYPTSSATVAVRRSPTSSSSHSRPRPLPRRPFSSTPASRYSPPPPPTSEPPSGSSSDSKGGGPPSFTTPLDDGSGQEDKPPISSCPEGTILTGLNYLKNQTDPVALADSAYPSWLWRCLDVVKRADDNVDEDAGDEFSKSKKQRRLAAKKQRIEEARLMASGNLDALAPKIPLHHQSINLPANEEGTVEGAISAAAAREDLRRAMRKDRRAKIKESNYLKSM
ncbi:putative NADH-ubiquinone oxidoreductase 12 kDa subunit, mitochondrial [Durotheca rogersii]|uniref:putative NADH-ubiquinone oxidoreductase 12 kDa subunit, mitochondrial n=1 Tax=Durotheca rogersii TaxID=419775 RepID=UPI002220DE86|nr:putative NADH-ubiquinone oxidoreductase 12 kDa subunit, mitochondrial [Durotheca rogersii]KAI5861871.1 putative NADH-ubiquinone oxidoreductase 12 kDa subunit, mitochondrial [Durotheca rogersii]